MISELSTVFISVFSTLTAGGTGFGIWQFRHNKKMNRLKEQLEAANLEKERISAKSDEWHIYKEQLDAANQQIETLNKRNSELIATNIDRYEKNKELQDSFAKERIDTQRQFNNHIKDIEERFNNQTLFLRGVQRELNQAYEKINILTETIGRKNEFINHLKLWLCCRPWKDCKRREPEQKIKPVKYIPFETDDFQELVSEEKQPETEIQK